MIGAGLGLIAIYVWRSRTHAMPIVALNLLRITSFPISTTGGSLFRVATGAFTLLMPLMLQLGFGYSAAASGGITFASAAGSSAGPHLNSSPSCASRTPSHTLLNHQ